MHEHLDEEFHVASRNSASKKHIRSAHLVHYADHVQRLVSEAPKRIDRADRVTVDRTSTPELHMPLEQVLSERTSSRQFQKRQLPALALWKLCSVATGIRQVIGESPSPLVYRRNTPSSGGLGAIETFVIALHVTDLPSGIYHFDSLDQDFVALEYGDFAEWLAQDVLFQEEFSRASAVIVLVGSFVGLRTKYGPRGYRSALIDAGHCSQNVYLASTALGLQVCATTGFIDDELDEALALDGLHEASLEVLLVGP